ncbi:MAG: response regulator [Ignavibacteriales bacterium]|nr:response regulator [Ignavibacteriales bacterium]MCF8316705.1 response regulator [Ignavibacteriales bacterium]MCF8438337.1 response regulator [Ignavibacteriales bacterium]
MDKVENLEGMNDLKTVLIVEDDKFNLDLINRSLRKKYKTAFADSEDTVYAALESVDIDLILMDISILGHKNGLQLTSELKASEKYSHIPVIAVTAHAYPKDRQNAASAGCDDFLAKPFQFSELHEKILRFFQVA